MESLPYWPGRAWAQSLDAFEEGGIEIALGAPRAGSFSQQARIVAPRSVRQK